MIRMDSKRAFPAFALCLSLLLAAAVLFAWTLEPVWAEGDEGEKTPKQTKLESVEDEEEDDEGQGIHKDPATFEKNFDLTPAQKIYTITECEKVVDRILTPEMSDLEKYYTLAVWVNQRVKYDWQFWGGGYNFDYYSHQWDAYGAMKKDELSVCVGIAIFYSNMCHAADLPCRFVRLDPDYLDHTINYIPDINGNAYYADVTENVFLMSDESGSSFVSKADKAFSHITKDATDYTFDFRNSKGDERSASPLKDDGKYLTYSRWFEEYASHEKEGKIFDTPYVEKGSGDGTKHASYHDLQYYPSQHYLEKPDIWFLDDFYRDPAAVKAMILDKEFDDQLLNVTGVNKDYDCDSQEALEAAVAADEDIHVEYFPSSKDGKVVAEVAALEEGTDFEISCSKFDSQAQTAELQITGTGDYSGTYIIPVVLNSAAVEVAPVLKAGLEYTGKAQELVKAGSAEVGEMQYALGTEEGPAGEFSTAIPTGTDAGKYYVWYKAAGDEDHADTQTQRVERAITIAPMTVNIVIDDKEVGIGKTLTLKPSLDYDIPVTFSYESGNSKVATVNEKGVVKGIKAGCADITIKATIVDGNPNYNIVEHEISVDVLKAANPIKVKGKTVTVKKKGAAIKRSKALKVSGAKGSLSYKLVSAKKGGKNVKSKFSVNAKSGKITVKKGLKSGTYKVKVKVKAKGTALYKASSWKKATITVKVR